MASPLGKVETWVYATRFKRCVSRSFQRTPQGIIPLHSEILTARNRNANVDGHAHTVFFMTNNFISTSL
jgi:hypothetical protein